VLAVEVQYAETIMEELFAIVEIKSFQTGKHVVIENLEHFVGVTHIVHHGMALHLISWVDVPISQ